MAQGDRRRALHTPSWIVIPPHYCRCLTRCTTLCGGTWKPYNAPEVLVFSGQQTVRFAYGIAGLGGRNKRMLFCNEVDTGLNVTRHESEPTFDWSLIAR